MSRNFWLLWLSQVINRFGDGFYTIPMAWVVYQVTGSAIAIGGLVFIRLAVTTAAQFLLSPIVDLRDRRRLMIALDLARFLVSAAPFWVMSHPGFPLWELYAVMFVYSALSTPYRSSAGALMPTLVDVDHLAAANAWLQGGMQSAYVIGPAMAGFFIARYGARPSFLVDAMTFLLSAAILTTIRPGAAAVVRRSERSGDGLGRYVDEIRAGLRTISRSQVLVLLVLLQSMMVFADSAFTLVIPYVRTVLDSGANGVGLLEGAISVGMIVASLVSVRPIWQRRPILVLASVPFFAVASAALAWTGQLAVAILLQAVAGIAFGLFIVRSQVLIQTMVPDELLGRTLMLRSALSVGAQAVGVVISVLVAQAIGVAQAFEVLGLVSAAIAGTAILRAGAQAVPAVPRLP